MSVSAAELPAMSRVVGAEEEVRAALRARLTAGLRRIAYFVIPSAVALVLFGDVIAAALYQRGEFVRSDTVWVWQILAAAGLGLLASTLARLYSSAFYALRDTRTPLKFAVIRIVLSAAAGYLLAVPLPRALGLDPRIGAAGLMLAGAVAAWLEFALLRRALSARIGTAPLGFRYVATLFGIAALGAVLAAAAKIPVVEAHPVLAALLVLPIFVGVYLAGTVAAGIDEARSLIGAVGRRGHKP
jgi:putative peptidoglycan lipid II flippase